MTRVGILVGLLAAAAMAQPVAQPKFDVASVKLNKSADRATANMPMGPGDAYSPTGGRFSATGFPLFNYILFAYKIAGQQAQSLPTQVPGWALSDRFDIEARAPGNPGKDEMRAMMRTLLAERFQLKMHTEMREAPVAALVLVREGKLGPEIQQHPQAGECPLDAAANALTPDKRFPLLCGGLLQMPPNVAGRFHAAGRNVTIQFIANSLGQGNASGRALVDRTGLAGKFDFNLEWTPDPNGAATSALGAEVEEPALTFEQALRDQLGMKIESQKGQVAVWVVDRWEKLTEN
jgi:uncharacterized protein (TIGR03435 family)